MSECDKSNAQVETSSKSNRRQPNAVNPIDISWDTPNVQNRTPARFPTTPNAPNTIRRTNKVDWRAQVSIERAQSLFSPRISNQSSINQQRRPAQRVLDFGDDESPSALDESLSTLNESLIALDGSYLDCVWLVEPIQAISKHSVNIDHGYNEASFTYKVFFCSATIKNVDKVVDDDVEALKRTDSCSIANYKHGEELIEIMTLSVFTGKGIICIERKSEFKPNVGPEKYEFSDDRLKYNVCCAAVLVNSDEVWR
uniref:Uncharacterized protein n=1 Tax=Acrobeloides nanus TaxID=290746 RepID=A0A914CQA2_9BILA